MEKFSILEVVEQAVQTEKTGYKFYTSMAEKFKENSDLAELFALLAEKELNHEKVFTELKSLIGDQEPEGWDEASLYLRAMVESEFFLGSNKSLASIQNISSIREAVDFAIAFEKETLLYFIGLKDAVQQKDIVKSIIDEEKSHIRWLAALKMALPK